MPMSLVREARFQVPLSVDGVNIPTIEVTEFLEMTARAFGGYSAVSKHGGWMSPEGTVVREPMMEITVAIPPTQEDNLRDFAIAACRKWKQRYLYWVDRMGSVWIEECGPQELQG